MTAWYLDGLWFRFDGQAPPWPVKPGVVINAARLNAIDETSAPWLAGYDKIVSGSSGSTESVSGVRGSQRYASTTYAGYDHGARILGGSEATGVGVAADGFYKVARDDGIACAVQAYLWYITGTATYRTNAINILDGYKDITSFGPGAALANTSYKPLLLGWAMQGFQQALNVLDDFTDRATIAANFNTYWFPSLWHSFGGNWLSTFACARLGIAAAAADVTRWEQALAYYDVVIKANVWLSTDGALVGELPRNETTGAASSPLNYPQHWWNAVPSNRSSAGLVNGQNCEFTRDDSHVMNGCQGLLTGCLTIEYQTGKGLDTYGDRLIATFEHIAGSILAKLDTLPTPITPSGGAGWKLGFPTALAIFGASQVPNVAELVTRDTEIAVPGTANNHIAQGLLWPVGT